jgi:hypothetical protein
MRKREREERVCVRERIFTWNRRRRTWSAVGKLVLCAKRNSESVSRAYT